METALQPSFDEVDTPLHQVTFVVVDVETTGGSPATDSLTEVAAARYRGGELLGTYQTFVRPDERIPPFITALTGISDAMVADAPRVGEMLPSLLEFVGGAVLVGHNLRFDRSFLDHALVATGREPLGNPTVDTLALARRLVRDLVPDCKLATLAAALRLPHQPSHRALCDVLATGDLLHDLLERAGSFGILGLTELLDLPALVGHPQGAKLRLTTRLPRQPGVYWFSDARGSVLHVGKAGDLRARVRSYFAGDRRPAVARLLRQLHTIDHWVCPDALTAAVVEGRLIRGWSPPYDQQGIKQPKSTRHSPRRRGRPRRWSHDQLDGDPLAILAPLAGSISELSARQLFEEAAGVRDEAERVRRLLVRRRLVESIRTTGTMTVAIDGAGPLHLDGGVLIGPLPAIGPTHPPVGTRDDDWDQERALVAQWLTAHAERVRILSVGPSDRVGSQDGVVSQYGWCTPADRIPCLAELCGPGSEATAA